MTAQSLSLKRCNQAKVKGKGSDSNDMEVWHSRDVGHNVC